MMDEFMVCVDRLIASACFESVNEREILLRAGGDSDLVIETDECSVNNISGVVSVKNSNNGGEGCSGEIVRECRICQEEDEEREMEAPCACNGTLKFAHRRCIQRWCNKKGDITCEICNQVYSPNYNPPQKRSNPEVMAIDIGQAWGPHIDLQDPHYLAFSAAERQFLQSESDNYAFANNGSLVCFHFVAITMMLILLIHQALMVTRDFGLLHESSTFFNFQVSLLQFAGFLLPCYLMARSCYIIQSRRRRQG